MSTFGELMDDVILDRFETGSRARAGRAINNRYAHLWSLEDWTFKYATASPTVAASDSTLNDLPADFGVPLSLWSDGGGEPLPYLPPADFYRAHLPASSGTPEMWTVVAGQVRLGPTPTATATWTLLYRKRLTPLSDDADIPAIPTEYHLALVHGARAELYPHYDMQGAPTFEHLWQLDIDAMRRDYLTDVLGQPSVWGTDPNAARYA